jgi:hypothetical protein
MKLVLREDMSQGGTLAESAVLLRELWDTV